MLNPDICVVHLVRKSNGLAPLANFLSTYTRFPSGADHALMFALKGFSDNRVDEDIDRLLNSVPHKRFFVPDWGYDITAYFRAASHHDYRYFCYVNSFSEILVSDWLKKLHAPFHDRQVGVVGATGSYHGPHMDWRKMPHRDKFSRRAPWKRVLLDIPFLERLNNFRHRIIYPAFPNPHLRTNAFVIERELMLALHPQRVFTKRQAYRFESGRGGMTAQIRRMGKIPLVVGRDGTEYTIDKWKGSKTFWESEQENLLMSDNQTRRYMESDMDMRDVFNWYAWGRPGA